MYSVNHEVHLSLSLSLEEVIVCLLLKQSDMVPSDRLELYLGDQCYKRQTLALLHIAFVIVYHQLSFFLHLQADCDLTVIGYIQCNS